MTKRYYVTIISRCLYEKYEESFRYLVEAKKNEEIEKRVNKLIEVLKKSNTLQDFEIKKIEEEG